MNFWTWGGDGSHSPANSSWPGDKISTTTTTGGKTWYTKQFNINSDDDVVNFVFSTGSGSPQTIDVTNISNDTFFEISTEKEGEKYKVNDVTSVYTGIRTIKAEQDDKSFKVYSLDGRLLRKAS